ncbi:hypothetical protein YA0850_09010 [Pseudomonas veronii]|uniref:Uncharacterized protein n=1 Tax=Pseudomonas veronii TaxID=76761 RepID=A0ABS0VR45_PSEVE|nr:hypothetical protein [Pseudomonas veronii]MBI6552557.1 hypothetical protein [Pseudomonas veronii]MBI6654016.1 hypothetical protein [Pseudomonas veronii]
MDIIITAALAHDHDKLIEVGVSRYEAFEEGHCKRGAKCWRCRWLGKRRMSPLMRALAEKHRFECYIDKQECLSDC